MWSNQNVSIEILYDMKFFSVRVENCFVKKDKYSSFHDKKINEKISSPEIIKPKNTP